MFTKDELSTLVAALEHYRREQTKLSVSLYRSNQIEQARRLDKSTQDTITLMDKCAMERGRVS